MKMAAFMVVLAVAALALASCAPGVNELTNSPDDEGVIAGFWRGLWNGIIAPITFIISLFNRNVQMYEVHNNGGWYNFGFLLGSMIILGGGGGGGCAARRRRRD